MQFYPPILNESEFHPPILKFGILPPLFYNFWILPPIHYKNVETHGVDLIFLALSIRIHISSAIKLQHGYTAGN
jgi:hypothetical protein